MQLTQKQQEAVDLVRALQAQNPEGGGVGIICGYAGTGKTTLLGALNENHKNMLVVTPTGKASVRVREAAGAKSSTICRWMYQVTEDEETGQLHFETKPYGTVELPGCGFLVVDEASMVSCGTFKELYRYCVTLGLNLVLVGDGFQLPPVEKNQNLQGFSVFAPDFPCHFRVELTEVMRQALDSPIVRVAHNIRTGRWADQALEELEGVSENKLVEAAAETFGNEGTTICHRNATRHTLNVAIRRALGRGPALEGGESLVVVKNNYNLDLYNGEVVSLLTKPESVNTVPVVLKDRHTGGTLYVNFLSSEVDTPSGPRNVVVCDKEVDGDTGSVGQHVIRRSANKLIRNRWGKGPDAPVYMNANLGYALTCHKSQGSEMPDVLVVIEDSIRPSRADGRRWLYTAVTRGQKRVRICWT